MRIICSSKYDNQYLLRSCQWNHSMTIYLQIRRTNKKMNTDYVKMNVITMSRKCLSKCWWLELLFWNGNHLFNIIGDILCHDFNFYVLFYPCFWSIPWSCTFDYYLCKHVLRKRGRAKRLLLYFTYFRR